MKMLWADRLPSPFGYLWAVVDEAGRLVLLEFQGGRNAPRTERQLERRFAARDCQITWGRTRLRQVERSLDEYFRGKRRRFELAVAPEGTPFQKRVWRELRRIPFGKTWSYARLAEKVGKPGAFRAVGAANGRNPVSLVIPCHRVIGSDGSLTGYGGGMERKRALLELEGAM